MLSDNMHKSESCILYSAEDGTIHKYITESELYEKIKRRNDPLINKIHKKISCLLE